MENRLDIHLTEETIDDLRAFSVLLKKDISLILEEALSLYFEEVQKALIEKGIEEDASMTHLDYDEFWDGLELD